MIFTKIYASEYFIYVTTKWGQRETDIVRSNADTIPSRNIRVVMLI